MLDVRHSSLSAWMLAGCVITLLSGCGRMVRERPTSGPEVSEAETPRLGENRRKAVAGVVYPDNALVLWAPCSRTEAEELASLAEQDGLKALEAAHCYAVLVRNENPRTQSESLAYARSGRKCAEVAAKAFPSSGLAHYLIAYLTGLEAERNPTRGLRLVSVIEHEATLAAELNPAADHGGPDRMLGELYLRAPGFPMSVGDSSKAITHFRRAVEFDPAYAKNRLMLVEALMAEEENEEACEELARAIASMVGPDSPDVPSKALLELIKKLCSRMER
jgi:tetratricopeptide (TPR) repeat protein